MFLDWKTVRGFYGLEIVSSFSFLVIRLQFYYVILEICCTWIMKLSLEFFFIFGWNF